MVKINMIEKISYYLAKKIYMCSEADVTCVVDEKNEDVQVLQYGIECMINMSIPVMVIFVCAWYFKMLIPMLIWCVMFLILRNYIGGYHVYILSNYSENMLDQTKDKLKFLPLMDGVVFSYKIKKMKPDPEIYEYLCDEYWLEPEESVFIDDRPVNIKGAETCGIHGIVFRSYEQAKKELDEFLKEF